MNIKNLSNILVLLGLLAGAMACNKTTPSEDSPEIQSEFPISFVGAEVSETKSVSTPGIGTATTKDNLASNGDIGIFGVKASSLTATGDNIFSQTGAVRLIYIGTGNMDSSSYGEEINKDTGWTYRKKDSSTTSGYTDGCESDLVYWQIGAYHRFRAFHPYDKAIGNLHSESYADQLMIHYSIENDNYDLLYASAWRYPSISRESGSSSTTANGFPEIDDNDTYGTGKVTLNFHHALAALKFNIQLSDDAAMNVDYLEEFYLTGLYASGLFICRNDQKNWGIKTDDLGNKLECDSSYWYLSEANEFDKTDKFYIYTPTDANGKDLTENSLLNAFGKDPATGTVDYDSDGDGVTETYKVGPLKIFGGTYYDKVVGEDEDDISIAPLGEEEGMVFVIPQKPSHTSGMTTYAHFRVWNKEGKIFEKEIPLLDSDGNEVTWESGKIYIYNITVGPVDVKIDVSIEDWVNEKVNLDIYL